MNHEPLLQEHLEPLRNWWNAQRTLAHPEESLRTLVAHACKRRMGLMNQSPEESLRLACEATKHELYSVADSEIVRIAWNQPLTLIAMVEQVFSFCLSTDSLPAPKLLTTGFTDLRVRDLRGVRCPMNAVKAKLELARMQTGECLELWLDNGSPIENVPQTLLAEGHKIDSREKMDGYWVLRVLKRESTFSP